MATDNGVRKTETGEYAAYICLPEKNQSWVGTFATAEETARAYAAAVRELHGTNFPLNPDNNENMATYKGVRKTKTGKYTACLYFPKIKRSWLGTFATAEEAARAYAAAVHELYGTKDVTNFPLNPRPSRDNKENVDRVRASGSCSADKAPTVIEIDDSETKRVEKKGTCERDKKRLSVVPLNLDTQPSEFVSDFTNFKILVGGTTIELPHDVRKAYFKLCCSQKCYLHCDLSKSMSREIAASVISETVTIANAIRGSKISTPQDDIAYWIQALNGCEIFGMNIGFIRARLNILLELILNLKRDKELKIERARVVEKIAEFEKEKGRLDKEIESMGKIVSEVIYDEQATAPW